MTKDRKPGTTAYLVLEAIRQLGGDEAAKVCRIGVKTLRDYSDPDRAGYLTFDQAMALDQALIAKGHAALFGPFMLAKIAPG